MNEENINGSAAIAASPVPKKPVRKHTERRVRLTDSFIRKLRPKDKPYSYGDSEVPGFILPTLFYFGPYGPFKGTGIFFISSRFRFHSFLFFAIYSSISEIRYLMTPPCLELSGLPRTSWGKPIPAQRHRLKVPGAMLYFSATCFSFNKSDMHNT